MPSTWKQAIRQPSGDPFPTITLSPKKGDEFKVLITPLWSPKKDEAFNRPERVRSLIANDLRSMLSGAVEQRIAIHEFEGVYRTGYYFLVTDKAPKPGEYPYAVRAGIGVSELLLSVTILSRSKRSEGITATIKALTEATHRYNAEEGDRGRDKKSLLLDGYNWSLLIDLPRFEIDKHGTRADGTGTMIQATNRETDVVVSVFLEKQRQLQSAEECKNYYWDKAVNSPLHKSRIKHLSKGAMAQVHFLVEGYQGIPLMQKNINAYLYRDGVCADIHLSKVGYKRQDDELFAALLDSVRYSDR